MQGNGAVTVLLVEDDEGLRGLMASLLEEASYATVEVGSGEDALQAVNERRIDVALLDVGLPGLSGYEVCRRLREHLGPALPIMFVSGTRTEALDRVAGLLIGADDYLVKPFAPEELLARVRALLRRAQAGRPTNGNGGGNGNGGLTSRELQVLNLLAEGRSQSEIAKELVISPKTVGTHLERILSKLGVHSRAQAVAVAYREGLLSSV
jgi:two-component system nitrate/nitrite response regulator NarL